eukprot:8919715-Prorocentrum_lima.AAC.1
MTTTPPVAALHNLHSAILLRSQRTFQFDNNGAANRQCCNNGKAYPQHICANCRRISATGRTARPTVVY